MAPAKEGLNRENRMTLALLGMAALIFVARVADVALGTLRTAFIVRGKRAFAFSVAFFEMLVWVVVVAQVINNLDHPIYIFAFALGFASGTVVGITIEGWFAIGEQAVRVFSAKGEAMALALREQGFTMTMFSGAGLNGSVHLLFIQVPRRRTNTVITAVRELDPLCYYTVDDVRLASRSAELRSASRSSEPEIAAIVERLDATSSPESGPVQTTQTAS
jgi:uncharacterized protein YebE (UPF0316 family)